MKTPVQKKTIFKSVKKSNTIQIIFSSFHFVIFSFFIPIFLSNLHAKLLTAYIYFSPKIAFLTTFSLFFLDNFHGKWKPLEPGTLWRLNCMHSSRLKTTRDFKTAAICTVGLCCAFFTLRFNAGTFDSNPMVICKGECAIARQQTAIAFVTFGLVLLSISKPLTQFQSKTNVTTGVVSREEAQLR